MSMTNTLFQAIGTTVPIWKHEALDMNLPYIQRTDMARYHGALTWDIPDSWSMEEAAGQIYCLFLTLYTQL